MTRQDIARRVTLLLLMPEAELIDRALRQYHATHGGGYTQLRDNVLEMLASSRYSEHELRRLGELGR